MSINVDQLLAQRRLETLTVEGAAENVVAADEMAWQGLESVLGIDPVSAWRLKAMLHTFVRLGGDPAVKFHAEFVRNPSDDPDEA